MALNEYFVRESGGSDSNGGTSHADGWATIQNALDNMTANQLNRLNLNGTITLSDTLDFSTYTGGGGLASLDTTLLLQGYSSTAGDGGIGGINGGGNEMVGGDDKDYLAWRRLRFSNWGATTCFSADNFWYFLECEFDGEGARTSIIDADSHLNMWMCKIHSIAQSGTLINSGATGGQFFRNMIQVDSNSSGDSILRIAFGLALYNTFSLNTTSPSVDTIEIFNDDQVVIGNTLFNRAAGVGNHIYLATSSVESAMIINNVIAGNSGTGGTGIRSDAGTVAFIKGYNKFWNNETDESISGDVLMDLGNDEQLSSNPFKSTGNADPEDDNFELSESLGNAWPTQFWQAASGINENFEDFGALQRTEPAGGVVIARPRRVM